jgi:hypothetical protein
MIFSGRLNERFHTHLWNSTGTTNRIDEFVDNSRHFQQTTGYGSVV